MALQPESGATLTYTDLLERFPSEEDHLRRELVGGKLFVTASPTPRHQRVVGEVFFSLHSYAKVHGGAAYVAPLDVYFSESDVVGPDVLFIRAENLGKVEKHFVRSAPDLVAEVSSVSTRTLELVRKKNLYERFGAPEYWFFDLDADQVQVFRLDEGYDKPRVLNRDDNLETPQLPGYLAAIDDLLGAPEPT